MGYDIGWFEYVVLGKVGSDGDFEEMRVGRMVGRMVLYTCWVLLVRGSGCEVGSLSIA